MNILKLRIRLWWEFVCQWFHYHGWYRVTLRWVKSETFPPGWWAYVLVVKTDQGKKEHGLGPIYQWTFEEVRVLAAKQAALMKWPELDQPFREPEPNPEPPAHEKQYRPFDKETWQILCSCGWTGKTLRCHGDLMLNSPFELSQFVCDHCGQAEREFYTHMQEVSQ